jgi:hypothetical protein
LQNILENYFLLINKLALAGSAISALPSPIYFESLSVPFYDGLWFDDY